MNKQSYFKIMGLDKKAKLRWMAPRFANETLGTYVMRRGQRGLREYLGNWAAQPVKTFGKTSLGLLGSFLAGGAAYSAIDPEFSKKYFGKLSQGLIGGLQNNIMNSLDTVVQHAVQQHPKRDKKGKIVRDEQGKPVMQQGKLVSLSKNLSPILSGMVKPLNDTLGEITRQGSKVGQLFGQAVGRGFQATGGKVLTGAGGAALAYGLSDLLQDWFQGSKPETIKQRRRRRVLNILSSLVGGAAGVMGSNRIFKTLSGSSAQNRQMDSIQNKLSKPIKKFKKRNKQAK